MKKGIHPETHTAKASCACGAEFETLSTLNEIKVTVCSKCHPFYTGKQKFVDTAGRIDKFERRYKGFGEKGKLAKAKAEAKPKTSEEDKPKAKTAAKKKADV